VARLGLLIVIGLIVLWLYALFDSVTADPAKVRFLQKPLWVLIVLLLYPFGSVLWLMFGRPRTRRPGGGSHGGGGWGGFGPGGGPFGGGRPRRTGPRNRPIAPDDDPDFLKSL